MPPSRWRRSALRRACRRPRRNRPRRSSLFLNPTPESSRSRPVAKLSSRRAIGSRASPTSASPTAARAPASPSAIGSSTTPGSTYKAAHYDHGNGVAVADVDGDGLLRPLLHRASSAAASCGGTSATARFENITARPASGWRTGSASPASLRRRRQRRRPRPLRHHRAQWATPCSRTTARDASATSPARAGVGYVGHSSGVVFFDYDRDGRLDLFLVNVGQLHHRRRRDAAATTSASPTPSRRTCVPSARSAASSTATSATTASRPSPAAAGIDDDGWSGDATIADFNDDRCPDLYVLNMQGDDHYYENQARQSASRPHRRALSQDALGRHGRQVLRLRQRRAGRSLRHRHALGHGGRGRSGAGGQEEHSTRPRGPLRRPRRQHLGNAFYEGVGGGGFGEVSDSLGAENYWPWGISVGDLNADGWEDVFISASMSYPFRYGINTLLLNERGERFLAGGVPPRGRAARRRLADAQRTPWFELDCADLDRATSCARAAPGGSWWSAPRARARR